MDLIAIDIGNSTISLGIFAHHQLEKNQQLALDQPDLMTRLPGIVKAYRELCGPQPLGAKTVPVVVCSVNPAAEKLVAESVADALDQRTLLIGRDFPLEMKVAVENPEAIGSDRLLTAYAAYAVIESAAVVADFGSATTIDCVNDHGIFLGGVIMPGLSLSAHALNDHTAALPLVDPDLPVGTFGINTRTAIANGIYYAAIGALRETVEHYAEHLGRWPQVVATGGYSRLIAEKCDFIDSLVPNLCLDGLYLAYRRYRDSLETET